MKIHARITVTVEVTVSNETWNEHTSVEQLHREGSELGVARIRKLCERYVAIVGEPRVQAVISNEVR